MTLTREHISEQVMAGRNLSILSRNFSTGVSRHAVVKTPVPVYGIEVNTEILLVLEEGEYEEMAMVKLFFREDMPPPCSLLPTRMDPWMLWRRLLSFLNSCHKFSSISYDLLRLKFLLIIGLAQDLKSISSTMDSDPRLGSFLLDPSIKKFVPLNIPVKGPYVSRQLMLTFV